MENTPMATSPESFQQVKDILRKLDRSIDAARSRRLGDRPAASPTNNKTIGPALVPDPANTTVGQPEGASHQAQARPTNRARPLIRNDRR